MIEEGFIKLHRKMLQWEWYTDINTKTVFLHCLFMANWKDSRFMGVDVPRGSFVSSYTQLAAQTKLSVQNVRTAINHLKSTGELTVRTTSKFSVITVINYNLYQDDNRQSNSQPTGDQQATNRHLTTIEERKNIRKEEYTLTDAREESEPMKHPYGIYNNVYLTDQEMDELIKAYPGEYQDMIENLSTYMRSKGKIYDDHYATMMKWKREDAEKKRQQADTYDYRKDVI